MRFTRGTDGEDLCCWQGLRMDGVVKSFSCRDDRVEGERSVEGAIAQRVVCVGYHGFEKRRKSRMEASNDVGELNEEAQSNE